MAPTPQTIILPSLATSFTLTDKLILDNYVDPTTTGEFIVEAVLDVDTANSLFGIYANVADAQTVDITKLKFNVVHPGNTKKTDATYEFTKIFPLLDTTAAKGGSTPGVSCPYVDEALYPNGLSLPEVLLRRIFNHVTNADASATRKNEPSGIFNAIGFRNAVINAADTAFGAVLSGLANAAWQDYANYVDSQDTGSSPSNQPSGNIVRKMKKADPDRFNIPLVENTSIPTSLKKVDGTTVSYSITGVTIDVNNKIYKNILIVGDKIRIPLTCVGNILQTFEAPGPTPTDPTTTTVVPNVIVILELLIVA